MVDLKILFENALPVVKNTAAYIWNAFHNLDDKQVEIKALNSMVTVVDKTAEKMLVDGLQKILPNSSFLTEEETVIQSNQSEYQWVIDPLDGTTNYIYGIPHFSISVALKHKGALVLGIVENIALKETYHAILGQGAFCNNVAIQCSKRNNLESAILVTGFPYQTKLRTPEYLQLIYKMIKRVRGIRRFGSAALDLAYVAAGRFDGYFERHLNPWDISAGALLVLEAQGIVSSFAANEDWMTGDSIIAASTNLHASLAEIIQENM